MAGGFVIGLMLGAQLLMAGAAVAGDWTCTPDGNDDVPANSTIGPFTLHADEADGANAQVTFAADVSVVDPIDGERAGKLPISGPHTPRVGDNGSERVWHVDATVAWEGGAQSPAYVQLTTASSLPLADSFPVTVYPGYQISDDPTDTIDFFVEFFACNKTGSVIRK